MSASEFNEQTEIVFKQIEHMVAATGVAIKQTRSGSALKLEFADGQRILINHDVQNHKIWLAALFAGTEYSFSNGRWMSQQDGSELHTRLAELIDQLIRSNPVNAQKGNLSGTNHARPQIASPLMTVQPTRSSPLKTIALFGLLAWLGYFSYQHFGPNAPRRNSSFVDAESALSDSSCDASFPTNGTTYIFPGSKIQPDNPGNTEISLSNEHTHPFLAIFTAPKSIIPYLSVLVQANQTAKVRLPAGQYDLMFSVGNEWCNARSGFSGGQRIKMNTTMTILPEQAVQMSAQSAGAGVGDFQIFIKTSTPDTPPPATQFIGEGVMEIRQHRDGHFHIAGSVNDFSVNYLIDTGASLTSLSQSTADRAGVTDCKFASFNTAGGTINGCIGRVAQLTIGNYQIQNATVAVMPNMEIDLLGMNVLNHFQISQANGVMRLGKR